MIPNERTIRLIVTLAEELHFGRAAAMLHVSQPALSSTVKNLELDLGVRLFRRNSRNVELTEAGRVFVAEAGRLIQEGERVIALVRRSSADIPGPLRIGYPASMNLRWLGALICRARREGFLSAEIQFISSEAVHLREDLLKQTLHCAFFAGQLRDSDLSCVTLSREVLSVAVCSGHSLARAAFVRIDQVRDEPVVWLRRDADPLLYDSFMALCSAQSYQPRVVQEVRTFYECLQFAREGVGITFLPSSMKSSECGDAVSFVCVAEDALYVEYTLAYRRDGDSNRVDQFVEFVNDNVVKTCPHQQAPSRSISPFNRSDKTNA